jgi:23S rRNA (pseudouridine1915-N3)-methyltransferase
VKTLVLAVGKLRGSEAELCAEYQKRLTGKITLKEIAAATQKIEAASLAKAIPAQAFVILCDERGQDLPSRALAAKFAQWQERGQDLVFMIGGADGVGEVLRKRADFTLSFGRATWPHRLARVMLLEQLYRTQQINAGHPYHRE